MLFVDILQGFLTKKNLYNFAELVIEIVVRTIKGI